MSAIMRIARARKLIVIEDAAHAHGARYKGRPAGAWGTSRRSRSSPARTHVRRGRHHHDQRSPPGRCVPLAAQLRPCAWRGVVRAPHGLRQLPPRRVPGAVLNAQLDRLEAQTNTRDRNGRDLAARLSGLPGLHPRSARPPARATATISSCSGSTGRRSARPGRLSSKRCAPKAFHARPGTGSRCRSSRCSGNEPSAVSGPCRRAAGLRRRALPLQRPDLPRAGPLARAVALPGAASRHGGHRPGLREDPRASRGAHGVVPGAAASTAEGAG